MLDSVEDEAVLGMTEQQVSSFGAIGWATLTDLVGADTGLPANQYVCVLNGFGGATNGQGTWVVPTPTSSILATGALERGSNGNWFLNAHAGRYGAHNWISNGISAGATCMPGRASANAIWTTPLPRHRNWPLKIADLAPKRRCFLSAIYAGDGMLDKYESYVRVRQVTEEEAVPKTIPYDTPGWYLESNAVPRSEGIQFFVRATCIDFENITGDWIGEFGSSANSLTNSMTNGNGTKFCGLQGVYGSFRGGFRSGVFLNAPSTQTGNWSMTVTTNKYGTAECIQ
ncbi:MAG: hypothetical protein ACKV2T_22275 [Kofleriaceae bacterium]